MLKKIVCYIDSMQMGGAERVMSNLCNWFASKQIDVLLVNDVETTDKRNEYPLDGCVRRHYLATQGNIKRIRELRRLIRQEKPDLVLSFLGPPNIRMLAATVGTAPKKVVSVRNDPAVEYGTGLRMLIAKILFRFADGVVFQTEDAAAYFPRSVRKRSTIIFNPVNRLFYETARGREQKHIVLVGRLQAQKNPGMMLEAFARIRDRYPDHKVVFYGKGELEQPLREQSLALGIADQVVFAGQVSDVPDRLAAASVYVMTSDYEGMPNALMEAMAIGVPVISTDCPCGGPRSIIQSRKQGILVKPRDAEKLASELDMILSDPEVRAEMRACARKRALDFYPDTILGEWESFLTAVLNGENAPYIKPNSNA